MTRVLEYNEALSLLKAQIEKKGEDYIYEADDNGSCRYFVDDEPSCIVGHVFHDLGIDSDFVEEFQVPKDAVDSEVLELSYEAAELLEAVQSKQDNGEPWGYALKAAVREVGPADLE